MISKKSIIRSVITLVVCAAVLFGLNTALSGRIAAAKAAGDQDAFAKVLPGGGAFEKVYAADGSVSTVSGAAATVKTVYREANGAGYVLELSTSAGYTKSPIELLAGVNAEGKLTGIDVLAYPETKDVGETFLKSFLGQDSAMADVALVAGTTFSSSAIKNAVADGFALLIENGLVKAGQKGAEQLFLENLGAYFPGAVNNQGIAQIEELEGSGAVTKAFRSLNGRGMALLCGEKLVVVSSELALAAFDAEGSQVSVDDALKAECLAFVSGKLEDTDKADASRLEKLAGEGFTAERTALSAFGYVSGAYRLTKGDEVLYGFAARSYGYSNEIMQTYFVLDQDGAIVSMNAAEFIFHAEYFSNYTLNEKDYRAGFGGLKKDAWTGEQALIAGATMSTDAVKAAVTDVFAAFDWVKAN